MIPRFAGAAVLALSTAACGGNKVKVDTAKLEAVHKVAIAGVCSVEEYGVSAGLKALAGKAHWGRKQVSSEAAAFATALPTAWRGVQILPPAGGLSESAAFSKGSFYGTQHRTCVGADLFDGKNKPDVARMKQMAADLQVDGVLAVYVEPWVESGGSTAHLTTNAGSPALAYLVNANGEMVVTASMRGVQSADVEKLFSVGLVSTDVRQISDQEHELLGTSIGQAIAARLAAVLQGG